MQNRDGIIEVTPVIHIAPIVIHPVENGLILESGPQRRVFEVGPGRCASAVRDVLRAIQKQLSALPGLGRIETRIEVRDLESKEVASTPDDGALLDTDGVARRLNISTRTVESMRAKGVGPVYHEIGGLKRYRVEDVDAWLALHRVSTHGGVMEQDSQGLGGRA
ncbi:helix-turn-helix transcriptional regulator [Nitratidesulfovibrio vulgaris]|uniref:helix-turn-helix transcriptional regulator n=1 Tax=Nitratidesulfovibrio vulgaris TaxID=881 RepID=UPI0013DF274A|nr:helix-turn-helix domain-containing protein [Nitratidesulfovibrio vulgaris]